MLAVKNVGKPCEGKLHARFDEGWVATPAYSVTEQASLLFRVHGQELTREKSQVLQRFVERDETALKRMAYAIRPDVVRQAWYDGILMRVLMLFGRI